MPRLIYYVAVSLDGFIAPVDGSVDWLAPYNTPGDDHGFSNFYKTVDALIEGSKTYEQALTFGSWPHPGKPCWVATQRHFKSAHPEVRFSSADPAALLHSIVAQGKERIWLVGGSHLAASFRAAGLITDYIVTVAPVLLGSGRRLFADTGPKEDLDFIGASPLSHGLVQLRYGRANGA